MAEPRMYESRHIIYDIECDNCECPKEWHCLNTDCRVCPGEYHICVEFEGKLMQ